MHLRLFATSTLLCVILSCTEVVRAQNTPSPQSTVDLGKAAAEVQANGVEQAITALQNDGTFTPRIAEKLGKLTPGDTTRVVVEFSLSAVPTNMASGWGTKRARENRATNISLTRTSVLNAIEERMLKSGQRRLSRGIRRTLKYQPYIAFEGTPDYIIALAQQPEVLAVYEDLKLGSYLTLSTGDTLVDAVTTRAAGFTGSGQTVAVLDSGIANDHEFFGGRVVAEGCFTDSCTQTQGPGAAPPATNLTGLPNFHGTHVAGIVAGSSTAEFSGVAPDANIIAVRVTENGPAPTDVSFASDVVAGLEFVLDLSDDYDIAAVNMSIGTVDQQYANESACNAAHPALTNIVNSLAAADIALVAASGNSGLVGEIGLPACLTNVIAVGASDELDQITTFTNLSDSVELLAPGDGPGDQTGRGVISSNSVNPDGYGPRKGTSFAAPHVAGAFAVMRAAKPEATVAEMLAALTVSGPTLTVTRFTNNLAGEPLVPNEFSVPRINVYNALLELGVSMNPKVIVLPLNGFMVLPIRDN